MNYNIVILSQTTTTVAGKSSDCLCYFDWSLLPRSAWKCRMTSALGAAAFNSNQVCQVFIELGIADNEITKIGGSLKYSSQYIGTLTNTNTSNASSWYSPATKNPPFYLNQTPSNNSFKLNLVNHGLSQALFLPNMTPAIFIISMEQVTDEIPRRIMGAYNIVFNSLQGTSTLANSVTYNFDWGRLKQGKYQMNTTMMTCKDDTNAILYSPIGVYCDLGQSNQSVFFVRNQDNLSISNPNFVALLFATGTNINGSSSTDALYTYRDQNAGIYLNNRPTNNDIMIELRNSYSGQSLQPYSATFNYTIVFHFQWLGE